MGRLRLVGTRGNPLKAMSNRAGKREREARRRHKRPKVSFLPQTGAEWVTLKLGRKKDLAFWVRTLSARPRRGMAAVPVADS